MLLLKLLRQLYLPHFFRIAGRNFSRQASRLGVFSHSGFLVWLIVLLPQTLLFSLVYILISVIAFDCARESRCRGGGCGGIRDFLIYLLLAAVAAVICALLEFLIVCLIFRPVSKVL